MGKEWNHTEDMDKVSNHVEDNVPTAASAENKNDYFMSKEFFEKVLRYRRLEGTAASYMGIEMTEVGPGWAKGELEFKEYHVNPIGSVHGGVIFFLADSVGGTAASSRGSRVTTANGNIYYLNAAMNPEKLVAEAVELKAGKNLLTYDVYIRTETGKLVAKATMEYFSLHKEI